VHFSLIASSRRGAGQLGHRQREKKDACDQMYIEEELDSGPILLQRETLIGEQKNTPELMAALASWAPIC